jgi:dolichyl-phosphate-mannose--protein O-mannosyl transferase
MRLPPPGPRRDLLLALLLALAAAAVRLPRLGFPPEEIFDEVYHAKTALQYLQGEPPTEWVHPPTAKLLIAVGVALFGYAPWAWRLLPALAGIALAPVFFLLARRVLPTERAALLASGLLLADGVYLVQSRTAMTNIFAVLFQVGSALFVVRSALRDRLPAGGMATAGLFLGLALSTRWTSLWAAGFLGLVLLVVRGRRLFRPREIGLTLLAFLVLPLLLYTLSYVPRMRQDHRLDTVADVRSALAETARTQHAIWRYHADLRADHPYFSKWWSWPWLYRPTWYYYKAADERVRGIVAIGNPALWWAAVPATLFVLVTGLRARDPARVFAGAGFYCLYLPWGFSPRTLNYSHYLFEAIPYACLALGWILDRHWQRASSRAYVGLVAALFVLFLPFLVALPVPQRLFYFRFWGDWGLWTWFPSWI